MEDRSDSEVSIVLSPIPKIDPSTLKSILKTSSSYSQQNDDDNNNHNHIKREGQVKFISNTKFSNEDHIALCIDRFDYIKDKGYTEYFIKVHK